MWNSSGTQRWNYKVIITYIFKVYPPVDRIKIQQFNDLSKPNFKIPNFSKTKRRALFKSSVKKKIIHIKIQIISTPTQLNYYNYYKPRAHIVYNKF